MDTPKESNNPIQAKQSRFLSLFGDISRINASLIMISGILALVCIILGIALIRFALTPKPIYYIPGALNAGYSIPNEIPKGSIIGFSSTWILTLLNFTPATIDDAHQQAMKYMDPKFLSKVKYTLEKERDEAKKSSISSVFTLKENPLITESETSFIIVLNGEHTLYMAQSTIKQTVAKYTLHLQKVSPTDTNPFGLTVSNVEQEEKPKDLK